MTKEATLPTPLVPHPESPDLALRQVSVKLFGELNQRTQELTDPGQKQAIKI